MLMIKTVKSIMILTVALWGVVGAIHNIADWSGTLGAVGAVTSMSTVPDGANSWQATSNSLVIWAGAIYILLSKLVSAGLCGFGAMGMWRARNFDDVAYSKAKNTALSGCAVAIIMLFGGFIIVAESWFELWRSESMIGPVLQSAFRYAGMIGLIALFVASKD
jgi:predicted small integral membrane protein